MSLKLHTASPHPESCRFCGALAVAVYVMSNGCVCFPDDKQQALCAQHAMRSEPLGTMEMIEDLTAGKAWTRRWAGRP